MEFFFVFVYMGFRVFTFHSQQPIQEATQNTGFTKFLQFFVEMATVADRGTAVSTQPLEAAISAVRDLSPQHHPGLVV
jgi:hypothetical protein